jgi:hypothetical protein
MSNLHQFTTLLYYPAFIALLLAVGIIAFRALKNEANKGIKIKR